MFLVNRISGSTSAFSSYLVCLKKCVVCNVVVRNNPPKVVESVQIFLQNFCRIWSFKVKILRRIWIFFWQKTAGSDLGY